MNYRFNEELATQAACYLIKKYGNTLNYMKLIKLLYMANRESIRAFFAPIVPDSYFSLPHGPVLSNVLDRITNRDARSFWNRHIKVIQNYSVRMVFDPGLDELSRQSLHILDKIDSEWHSFDQFQIRDWMHANLPEWEDPNGSSILIQPEAIFRAVGIDDNDVKQILAEEKQYQKEEELFAALGCEEGDCVLAACGG